MKKPRVSRRALLKLGVLLVFAYMFFRWFEHSQVYHPTREIEEQPRAYGLTHEDVYFKTTDGVELNGWFFAGDTNSPRSRWVILICHGNGGNISHRLELYRALLETGASIFAFDYRGYGRSRGRPSEEGTYLDAQAAHHWLRDKGFPGKNVIAYGESLGGAVATELCLREEAGGLVLQSTFTSIPEIGAELFPWLPVRLISTINYDTRSKLSRLKIPVLIMHSREDGLIGYKHSERNFEAANEPKFFCELRGGHNDAAWELPQFEQSVERFLNLLCR